MLIVDVSKVNLPAEAKLNNLPPECGQLIDGVSNRQWILYKTQHRDKLLVLLPLLNQTIRGISKKANDIWIAL
jgi:hypothetical protein